MKRHGSTWEDIVSTANLHLAFSKARRHKNWQCKIQALVPMEDELVNSLHETLVSGRFKTSPYHTKSVYEPKQRTIYILPFWPDRVVHHAIMNILEPIWDGLLIHDTYACRQGKGQHAGSKRCMGFVRRFRYCLKCDVSKFYPSVRHDILKTVIRKKLKDSRTLELLDGIIDSVRGDRNIPIGNFLSQWFGNIYLNELDMFVKHRLRVRPYLRYCDDFCLFSDDKRQLRSWAFEIKKFLDETLDLRLSKCEVFPTTQGVDFLGYRHFAQGYILVRKSTAKRMKRRMARIVPMLKSGRLTVERAMGQLASTDGWMRHACAWHLRQRLHIDDIRDEIKRHEKV